MTLQFPRIPRSNAAAFAVVSALALAHGDRAGAEGGELKGTVTWSGLVYLDRDVVVPEKATLIIKPGTVILAQSGKDAADKGRHPDLVEIRVLGSLKAEGTAKDPILFTAVEKPPTSGSKAVRNDDGTIAVGEFRIDPKRPLANSRWGGIFFEAKSTGALKHCQISRADSGVFAADSAPILKDCVVFECDTGIQGGTGSKFVAMNGSHAVDGCHVFRCAHGLYFINGGNPKITDTAIVDCGIGFGYLGRGNPTVDHCIIAKAKIGVENRTMQSSAYTSTVFAECKTSISVWIDEKPSLDPFKGKLVCDSNAFPESGNAIWTYTDSEYAVALLPKWMPNTGSARSNSASRTTSIPPMAIGGWSKIRPSSKRGSRAPPSV